MRSIHRLLGRLMLAGLALVSLWGCREADEPAPTVTQKATIEKTVAIVLPMEKGLAEHWQRSLDLYTGYLDRAYKNQDTKVVLNFEIYDEGSEDLEALAAALAKREDVYAVAGGLYSSDAAIITPALVRVGKPFFTIATAEDLVRGYASTGNLWAMTETDITQCEVLLAKVVNYGARSVALIAKEGDIYGKTFLDWFAFQARELGLQNCGVFPYTSSTLESAMEQASTAGADYLICVPSEIEEIGPMLAHNCGYSRLLFSDTAYGTDVLTLYGSAVEGIEGVCFGADPEAGFDVSYRIFFGEAPTTGEAQLYDALMLIGYAAWYQHLHPDASVQEAIRAVVTGQDINMGSWMGEDMSLVIDALAQGASPTVRGASGPLRFDNKVFTNVLATTYYNYRVYEGKYIILDYNSSDGGNRTDATLAGWNWKASQMQEFGANDYVTYPAHTDNWALLVAASSGWSNYRHQADVLAIYRRLRESGFPDDRIILIMEDDLATHEQNPLPGVIRVTPGGPNVYENVEADYRLSALSPADFLSILRGERSGRLPKVVESGKGSNIFLFWSGHGVPGALCWDEEPIGLTGRMLAHTLRQMGAELRYRKILMMTEACYSGGVMQECEGIPGILCITAANGEETSKADIFSGELGVWMSNRFTATFIEQISADPSISMRDLYYRLFLNTVGSHVMVYNAPFYGNLYSASMAEFLSPAPAGR